MDKTVIYYFSGSGNSLAVARDIAGSLHARLEPLAALMSQKRIDPDAEALGFVFPIYDFKPPEMVDEFVQKLHRLDKKYLFAVCTYGIAPSRSLVHFSRTLAARGGRLSAGFAVEMPHNGIGSRAMDQRRSALDYQNWKRRLPMICETVRQRRPAKIETSLLFFSLFSARFIRGFPSLVKLIRLMTFKGVDSLRLQAGPACGGCGTCTRVCPVNNIHLVNGQPRWSDHCMTCFACVHWCPRQSITIGGYDLNIVKYHHPEVKVGDMVR